MKLSTSSASKLLTDGLLLVTLTCLAAAAYAQQAPATPSNQPSAKPHGGSPTDHRPPAEALAACSSKQAEQACSFRGHEREISGTCWAPQGKPLACRPNDKPQAPPPASSAKRP